MRPLELKDVRSKLEQFIISTWFAIGGEGYGTLDAARMHGSGTMPW